MARVSTSFVIGSLNEGGNLKKTIQSLQANTTGDYEIIVVDDGSSDGSTGFIEKEVNDSRIHSYRTSRLGSANSKNFGAQKAQGEYICFLDAHILFKNNWWEPLMQELEKDNAGIVAPALSSWEDPYAKAFGMRWRNARLDMAWLPQQSSHPYTVPMVGLACMAFRREIFNKVGEFDNGLKSYGNTDQEVCLRTWLLGYEVDIVPQVVVSHLFRSRFPYPVSWLNTVYNKLRTAYSHFKPARMKRSIAALKSLPSFNQAYGLLQDSDIENRRQKLLEIRKYDDDWFFDRFGMTI